MVMFFLILALVFVVLTVTGSMYTLKYFVYHAIHLF